MYPQHLGDGGYRTMQMDWVKYVVGIPKCDNTLVQIERQSCWKCLERQEGESKDFSAPLMDRKVPELWGLLCLAHR